MYEKWTLYNYKGTKIDGVEPKRRGTPATKRGFIIESAAMYHHCNSEIWTIQLPER